MGRIATMTYGTMPTREQFDAGCLLVDDGDPPEACVLHQGFRFGNDGRLGDAHLTADELWKELWVAKEEYDVGHQSSGDWLSDVLGCLGIEWV